MKLKMSILFGFFFMLMSPFIYAMKKLDETDGGGRLGTNAIETAVGQIDEIIEDVTKATEEDSPGGKKITITEGLNLIFSDAGKLIKIINASGVIWDEVKDLETEESPKIIAALEGIYTPENPFIKEAAGKLVTALIGIKEAAVALKQAKDWNKE
jgi:hypothetical protein